MAIIDPFDTAPKSGGIVDPFEHAAQSAAPPSGMGAMASDVGKSILSGAAQGPINALKGPGEARQMLSGATDYIGNKLGLQPETINSVKNLASYVSQSNPVTGMVANAPSPEDVQATADKFIPSYTPQGAEGRIAKGTTETMTNPVSYFGPGGFIEKMLMAGASGFGSEAAGEAFKDSALEGPARIAGSLIAGPLAARAANPQLRPAAQALVNRGIELTPGQMIGENAGRMEDKLAGAPFLGGFIRGARQRSVESFNKAVGNEALSSIGERLSPGTQAGHEAVDEVERKLGNAYDTLIPNLTFHPDAQFAQDMSRINRDAGSMPQSYVDLFKKIIDDRLSPNRWVQQQMVAPRGSMVPLGGRQIPSTWSLTGSDFKDVESELTHLASRYGSSMDGAQQLLGDRLRDVVSAMRSNLERSNPSRAAELKQVNRGWAMYTRMRTAAANRVSSEGVFTPGDMLSAIKRGDSSVGKGAFARGDALMQDFASSAQNVLPTKLPNSGTAERASALGLPLMADKLLHMPHLALGAAGLIGAYSSPVTKGLSYLARPTRGFRGDYASAGRGATPALRALMTTPDNPFAQ